MVNESKLRSSGQKSQCRARRKPVKRCSWPSFNAPGRRRSLGFQVSARRSKQTTMPQDEMVMVTDATYKINVPQVLKREAENLLMQVEESPRSWRRSAAASDTER